MRISKQKNDAGKNIFTIFVSDGAEGQSPISVGKKDSLQIKSNDKVFKFSTEDNAADTRQRFPGIVLPIVVETVRYQNISEDEIKEIFASETIIVKIEGVGGFRSGSIAKDSLLTKAVANLLAKP